MIDDTGTGDLNKKKLTTMTTQEIFTTNAGKKVSAQLSPKRNNVCRILVDGFATDARIYSDDSIEDATFQITSSTPLGEQNAKEIAQAALEFLKSQI